jgi:hypothetical protein
MFCQPNRGKNENTPPKKKLNLNASGYSLESPLKMREFEPSFDIVAQSIKKL